MSTYTFASGITADMNDSMDFIIGNLTDQYVIPNYARGENSYGHDSIDGLKSHLRCIIEVSNVKHREFSQDLGNTLGDMAEIIVDDYLERDCNRESEYDSATNSRKPPRRFFKVNYIRTITRMVEISGETFEVNLTYERKYEKM
jgi:hypothetical protein